MHLEGLGLLDIIVAFPKLEDAIKIKNILLKNGYSSVVTCNSASQVIEIVNNIEGGIVICGYKLVDMLYLQLYDCLPKGFLMMLLASPTRFETCYEHDITCVAMPLKLNELLHSLDELIAIHRKRFKKEKRPKERSEKEKQVIAEAKELLMVNNNMTENEAHRYIQKISMDSGNSLSETAQMILLLR